jgi:prophage maintenance system killer protein/prophage antirepressor-like protein
VAEIVIFQEGRQHVEVRLEGETVWLTQEQMARLFDRDRTVITRHVRNVFREGELDEESNVQKMHIAGSDKPVAFYNLDVIISVGYRVKSPRGVRFRQWATRVLREHLTHGYSLNEHRLAQRGLAELEQAVHLLSRTLEQQALANDIGREAVALIAGYAKTWRLLLQYDEQALSAPEGPPPQRALSADAARGAIAALKQELMTRGEASELFGREREPDALGAILGNLDQTMFGEPLYKTRDERAAHLLYFVIKDHPLSDGNKRCGAFLFLLYLRQEGMRLSLNDNGLTALALLVAESEAVAKPLMIRLICHLLAGPGA